MIFTIFDRVIPLLLSMGFFTLSRFNTRLVTFICHGHCQNQLILLPGQWQRIVFIHSVLRYVQPAKTQWRHSSRTVIQTLAPAHIKILATQNLFTCIPRWAKYPFIGVRRATAPLQHKRKKIFLIRINENLVVVAMATEFELNVQFLTLSI